MSDKPKIIVYSNDREWVQANEAVMKAVGDWPMYVLSTRDYGPGAALWNIDGDLVLVFQDLNYTLGRRTGLEGHHELNNYVDLFLAKIDALMEILTDHGYSYDYSWLSDETAAPPIKESS